MPKWSSLVAAAVTSLRWNHHLRAILSSELSMASTSTPQPNPTPQAPGMTLYVLGMPVPSGTFEKSFMDSMLAYAKKNISNIVPTTYEASKAYLDEELLKAEGHRDLTREMCMIMVLDFPNGQELYLKNDTMGLLIELSKGSMMFMPTVDIPPTAFGTPENRTSSMLVNKKTSRPARATVVLSYFSKSRDIDQVASNDADMADKAHTIQLDHAPYQ